VSDDSAAPRGAPNSILIRAAPGLFVLLWATGFIGAKLGLPYAEPLTFLLARYVLVGSLLLIVTLVSRAPWPRSPREAAHIAVAGLLVHAIYLGGVFSAIHKGLPSGVVALIAGLQPLLTAVWASLLLGEHVSARNWLGLALGLVGVALVLWDKLVFSVESLGAASLAFLALFGITVGVLYQKRYCAHMDLRSGSVIQYFAAALPTALVAPLTETMQIEWSGNFIFALTWLVLVLSLGAISLLYLLIRHGQASRVASLFYLVPPVTAVLAFLFFGESLGPSALFGMAITVVGVALALKS
jgi:drug/metabolite transporter (DMT)-like permease